MIDRKLDGIHVMLLRLDNDDQYKEALYKEYELYRTSLEALPRDVNIPQILDTSVFSFEQRLKNYIVLGKSNNPLIELAPTISKRITSREDIAEILQIANSNSSYIQNKKSQLEVLKSYLDQINFNGDIDDIFSTIKLVEERYLKLNIYSNEFEQEIAKAKYYYELKLLYDGEISRAKEYAEKFDSDLILFIHSHHKDTVHKLLNDGKSKLADELNSFLTEFPKDREKDIEFWKTLAQIENPEYNKKITPRQILKLIVIIQLL